MERAIDRYYLSAEEPHKGALQALRHVILSFDSEITEAWKYGMPFFCYRGKMFCYVWVHKKFRQPYMGIVDGNRIDHEKLLVEKRARMKILLVDPQKDLPVKLIRTILKKAMEVRA
jgi:hypothetical protein